MSASQVDHPAMRREVMRALASLSDRDYQERVWRQGQRPGLDFYDDFKANVDCLYDDCEVLPHPDARLGSVLLPGDELERLRELAEVLDEVINRLGTASLPMADASWSKVVQLAGVALSAMVRAGGYADC